MPEKVYEFQSTPSAWRETIASQDIPKLLKTFQSTPSVWRETSIGLAYRRYNRSFQSTPSVWRETFSGTKTGLERRISIHSLRMEGDSITPLLYLSALIFQSTPSVWRETVQILRSQVNPIFQSTPSVWRETLSGFHSFQCFTISIHSLRMEGDNCSHRVTLQNVHFNPLPPYGGRLIRSYRFIWTAVFQSTPSVWRETGVTATSNPARTDFNPLPPYGGRPFKSVCPASSNAISIHSLRMEGDVIIQRFRI